jgi:carbamoyltransferase
MTLLFDTKPEFKESIPTIVHPIDKTARIQIVTPESNALFYNILNNFKDKSGIGCLVNTSFNVHNEPIVERPEEAFTHLKNGIIDYLITPKGIWHI